jgi:hypothetical protein
MEEQEVTMNGSIRTMQGIGPQAVEVFEGAGFFSIIQLHKFDGEDERLWAAIEARKATSTHAFSDAYWKRLFTRCINIIFRARSAEATDYIPHEYMCPISLDWYHDPVTVASGQSYSRQYILDHMKHSQLDPVTRMDLTGTPMYDNVALRNAVEHFRLHYSPLHSKVGTVGATLKAQTYIRSSGQY